MDITKEEVLEVVKEGLTYVRSAWVKYELGHPEDGVCASGGCYYGAGCDGVDVPQGADSMKLFRERKEYALWNCALMELRYTLMENPKIFYGMKSVSSFNDRAWTTVEDVIFLFEMTISRLEDELNEEVEEVQEERELALV